MRSKEIESKRTRVMLKATRPRAVALKAYMILSII